jgi:putative ABC transport system permease protein
MAPNLTAERQEVLMDTLIQDLKYGVRTLLKSPAFTIVALLALSFGIAINTAIFTVVYAVLIEPLPYTDPDRIYMMWEKQPHLESSVAYPNFLDWRSQNHVFESMAAFRRSNMNLTGEGDPERLSVRMVSADFFHLLGAPPAAGRDFRPQEDRPGSDPVVLLSHGLWERRFGSNPEIVGKVIHMDDVSYTIIGIAPAGFEFGAGADVFVPIGHFYNPKNWARANHPGIYVLGRLKEGVSPAQMDADMQAIAATLSNQYPESNKGAGITIQSLRENTVGDVRPSLLLLTFAVALVLLIACANVANMMLARTAERSREIAVRASLGAPRSRIARQFLTESFVLTSTASIIGIFLASWGVDLLQAFRPDNLPQLNEIAVNMPVLFFTVGVTVVTALLLGLLPALRAANPDLNDALKDASSKQSGSIGQGRLRQTLVASEVALALLLLIAAGLLTRSFILTQHVDPGFRPDGVLTMQISLPEAKYASSPFQFFDRMEENITAIPGVRSAGYSNGLPFAGAGESVYFIEGRPQPPLLMAPQTVLYVASPGYFDTMGIRLIRGRFFTKHDDASSAKITIVDETLARAAFPGEEALGKRISMGHGAPFMTIVGVVQHVAHYGLDSAGPVQSQMYFPLRQVPEQFLPQVIGNISLVVRTDGAALSLVTPVRKAILAVDPNQPVFKVQPMKKWLSDSLSARRFGMSLISIFAGAALMLALIGLYGVISYSVVQRTREIGIRVALGAARADILAMILKQGLIAVVIGLLVGLAGALVFSRLLSSFLYEVTPHDPTTFASIPMFLLAVALLASYIPARRALKIDPTIALRYE